jgi:hypothetical protein
LHLVDLPNFADEAGLTCTDYADDAAFDEQYPDGYYPVESWYGYYPDESWCLIFGIDANADNITAQASCCVCGGGIRSPFVPGTTNAPTFATTLPGAISSAPTFHNGGWKSLYFCSSTMVTFVSSMFLAWHFLL